MDPTSESIETSLGQRPRRSHRARAVLTALAVAGPWASVIVALAATAAGAPATTRIVYEPYDESEVRAALQRPLQLEDCVRIALAGNLALRISQGDLRKAEAGYSASYAKFLPAFSLEGTRQEVEKLSTSTDSISTIHVPTTTYPQIMTAGIVQTLPTGATVNFSRDLRRDTPDRVLRLSMTQPLLRGAWPWIAWTPVNDASYEVQGQTRVLDDAKRQTALAATLAYYDVLTNREVMRVNADAVHADSELVRVSDAMFAGKVATRRDVLSARIRLSDDLATSVASRNDYELSLERLADILGLPPETQPTLADVQLKYAPVELDEPALVAMAVRDNPGIDAAEIAVRQGHLRLRASRNATLPSVDLNLTYTKTYREISSDGLPFEPSSWAAGVRMLYPLQRRDAVGAADVAQADLEQRSDRLENLRRQLTLQVRSAVRTVRSIAQEITSIEGAIAAAQDKVEFANAMFSLGRASNLDITDARQALVKSRTQYVRRIIAHRAQLGILESLTGQPLTP